MVSVRMPVWTLATIILFALMAECRRSEEANLQHAAGVRTAEQKKILRTMREKSEQHAMCRSKYLFSFYGSLGECEPCSDYCVNQPIDVKICYSLCYEFMIDQKNKATELNYGWLIIPIIILGLGFIGVLIWLCYIHNRRVEYVPPTQQCTQDTTPDGEADNAADSAIGSAVSVV